MIICDDHDDDYDMNDCVVDNDCVDDDDDDDDDDDNSLHHSTLR